MPWSDPKHKREHRKKRNPCGSNLPNNVSNIAGQFQRKESQKYTPFRLKVTWGRVTQTQAGEDYKPDAYGIQVWGSPDGATWEQDNLRHKQVRGTAGPDGDWDTADDTKVPNFVLFYNIKPKWYYRIRVRALSKKECDGTFGDWVELGRAIDAEAPAKPLNVRIWENSTGKRVVLDWDPPLDPDDDEQMDQGVTFFQVQLSKTQNFTLPVYRFDKIQAATHRSFRIADADLGDDFYGRVRSIDAAGNKSAWIPATANGNSNPNATATAAKVGSSGGGELVIPFSHPGVIGVRRYPTGWTAHRDLRITKVVMRAGAHDVDTHPNDGCPRGGPIYGQIRIVDESDTTPDRKVFTSDSKLKVPGGEHKDTAASTDMDETDINEGETLVIGITKGEATDYNGRGLNISIILEPR